MNLPYKITVNTDNTSNILKGTITYIYDALGNKLEKRTDEAGTATNNNTAKQTQTAYAGSFVYENNKLQFLGHEEGRIRLKQTIDGATGQPLTAFVYDYFLKDHLGNVRMVLTDEVKQDVYPAASLEDAGVATEKQYYDIQDGNAVYKWNYPAFTAAAGSNYANNNGNPPYNNNPSLNVNAESQKLYKLNGANNVKFGLGITLKVMAGDNVDILGKSFYHLNSGQSATNGYLVSTALLNLLTSFTGGSAVSGKGVTGSSLYSNTPTTDPFPGLLNGTPSSPTAGAPKAGINWILFDEQFRPLSVGFDAVDGAETIKSHQRNTIITQNGYLYVYCSDESNVDVFFDNIQVIHNRGPLVEETHYYPFGLTMSGISSKAAGGLENRGKFNDGTELENKEFSDGGGLDLYATEFRSYDPQIGRWHQIDPLSFLTDDISPYAFSRNNPISYNDPFGLTDSLRGATKPDNIEPGQVWVKTGENGQEWFYTYNPNDPNAATEGAYAGFVSDGGSTSSLGNVTVSNKKKQTSSANTGRAGINGTGPELARRLINSGRITFGTRHPAPPNPRFRDDLANADDNIRDASEGNQVHTSEYGHARGVLVTLDPRLLRMLDQLSERYTLEVSEIAGARHGANSRHYVGIAVDITGINGRSVNASNPYYRQLMQTARQLGAGEVLGPGAPNHGGHIHLGMPR